MVPVVPLAQGSLQVVIFKLQNDSGLALPPSKPKLRQHHSSTKNDIEGDLRISGLMTCAKLTILAVCAACASVAAGVFLVLLMADRATARKRFFCTLPLAAMA